MEDTAGYSPAVQAMAALAASKLPVAEASVVLEHLAGVQLPPATPRVQAQALRDLEIVHDLLGDQMVHPRRDFLEFRGGFGGFSQSLKDRGSQEGTQ